MLAVNDPPRPSHLANVAPLFGKSLVKAGNRLVAGRQNLEELIELRDDEDFQNLRLDIRQAQLSATLADFVVGIDQRAQCGAAEMIDGSKVEQHLWVFAFLNQRGQGVPDLGDVGLVQDAVIGELDDADVLEMGHRNGRNGFGHASFLQVKSAHQEHVAPTTGRQSNKAGDRKNHDGQTGPCRRALVISYLKTYDPHYTVSSLAG